MKTLAELQTEIELGLNVYPSTNHDVWVFFAEEWYVFARTNKTPVEKESVPGSDCSHGTRMIIGANWDKGSPDGGIIFEDCYQRFEALLADWPSIAAQPVWSTAKTLECLRYEEKEREEIRRELQEIEERQMREMLERRSFGLDPFV